MPNEVPANTAPPAAQPAAPAADPKKPAPPPSAAKGAPAPPQPAGGAPAVAAAQDKLEAAGGEVPDQKRGESDQDYEVRLSRLTRELKSARQEAQRNKVDKQQFDTMKAELEKAKNKRLTKAEFVQLVKDLDAGKAQLDDDEWAALPPAIRERIQRLESAEEARAREAQERQNAEQRTKEEGIVQARLKELSADLPLFEGRETIHSDVLDVWYERFLATGQKPDLDQVAQDVHAALAQNVVKALQSESTRRFLTGKHPDLKALLGGHEAKASGPTSEAKGSGGANGRAAEPAPSSDSTPQRKLTRFEQEQAATARMRAKAEEIAAEIRARKAEEAASRG